MRTRSAVAAAIGFALFGGCVIVPDYSDHLAGVVERSKGPPSESEWNNHQVWRRVDDGTSDYIPVAYPKSAPRSDDEGEWIVDDRPPGKRLFVPYAGAGEYSFGVLRGEAIGACEWTPRGTKLHVIGPSEGTTIELPNR